MSLLNQTAFVTLPDSPPTVANESRTGEGSKSKTKKVTKLPCTPFCDIQVDCPKHHELVLTLMNCNDCQGIKSNLIHFQKCVVKCIEQGWNKNDIVPDPREELRLPLVVLACAFGRCLALEWLLKYGFEPNVKCPTTGQVALHFAICGMHRSRVKCSTNKMIPKLNRLMASLPKQMMFHDDLSGDTPLHTAVTMLTTSDSKSQFFQACVEAMSSYANKADCPANTILDAINYQGRTALHLLAASCKKVEFCASAIRALVSAGANKTIRDNNGETALDIAFANGIQNIVHELLRNGERLGLGLYSELEQEQETIVATSAIPFPSPSRTDDSDSNWSDRNSSASCVTTPSVGSTDHITPPTMTCTGIKRESLTQEKEHCTSSTSCECDPDEAVITTTNISPAATGNSSSSPAVLKYLGDAGLLADVSALVARARAQDEANMRKIQSRASEIDAQMKKKKECIDKMKQELSSLRMKRKECDVDFERLKKRMHSCESAMKELPNSSS